MNRFWEMGMLGRMMCGFMVLCALSAPVLAAETADREKSPYGFGDLTSSVMAAPLPSIVEKQGSAFRMYVSAGGAGTIVNELFVIETHPDGRPAKFTFERIVISPTFLGIWRTKKSEGSKELTEVERNAFSAAFDKIKICSTSALGLDGFDGHTVYLEFANDTRHCFAERWSPDWDDYAPEFVEIENLVEGFSAR